MWMPFFKRILKYDQKTVAKQEKRYATRFKVSSESPLKVSLKFDYLQLDGTAIDLSTLGAAVLLPREFACPKNTPCKITFALESCKLTVDAVISHHRTEKDSVFISNSMILKLGSAFSN